MEWVVHFRIHNSGLKALSMTQPHVCDRPVIIMNRSEIIEISTAAARRGIKPGMSRAAVMQVCPDVIVMNQDQKGQEDVMRRAFAVVLNHCSRLEPTGLTAGFGAVPGKDIHSIIQAMVVDLRAADLEATIGAAANRLLARIASGTAGDRIRDQTGTAVINEPGQWFSELKIDCLWPVPEQIRSKLSTLGMSKIQDVQVLSVQQLSGLVGPVGYDVARCCRGEDSSAVAAQYPPRQICRRLRLPGGVNDKLVLERILRRAADELTCDLGLSGEGCRTVTVTFDWEDGQWTGNRQWEDPVSDRMVIEHAVHHVLAVGIAGQLIDGVPTAVTIAAEDLAPAVQQQQTLFSPLSAGGARRRVRGAEAQVQVTRREQMLELFDPVRGAGSR